MPDDGNRYELVDGERFVTPAPSPAHEALAAELLFLLVPYVLSQKPERVCTPRSVARQQGSEVEPDMMVRPASPTRPQTWVEMPPPLLVVTLVSRTTRRRDHEQKRAFYLRLGVAAYWIIDRFERTIRVIAQNANDVVCDETLVWCPAGATEALHVDVPTYFSRRSERRRQTRVPFLARCGFGSSGFRVGPSGPNRSFGVVRAALRPSRERRRADVEPTTQRTQSPEDVGEPQREAAKGLPLMYAASCLLVSGRVDTPTKAWAVNARAFSYIRTRGSAFR